MPQRMLRHLRSLVADFTALAYPPRCRACAAALPRSGSFCETCDQMLRTLEDRPHCVDCGAPLAAEGGACQRCEGRGYRLFDRVVPLAVFDDPLKHMVHRLKYLHGWPLGEVLAERAMRLPRVRQLLADTDVLLPVPLHPWRQICRGFNQAEVFARRVGALSKTPVVRPLVRLRATPPQTLQHRDQRVRNLRQAFALVKPGKVRGLRVTLVDDVMTTGSTLKSAASAVRAGNPLRINVLTLAIADPKNRRFEAV